MTVTGQHNSSTFSTGQYNTSMTNTSSYATGGTVTSQYNSCMPIASQYATAIPIIQCNTGMTITGHYMTGLVSVFKYNPDRLILQASWLPVCTWLLLVNTPHLLPVTIPLCLVCALLATHSTGLRQDCIMNVTWTVRNIIILLKAYIYPGPHLQSCLTPLMPTISPSLSNTSGFSSDGLPMCYSNPTHLQIGLRMSW